MIKRLASLSILVIALLLIGCPSDAPGDSTASSSSESSGSPPATSELTEFQNSNYISEGDGNLIAYAFTDPQCPACNRLHRRVADGATPNVEWRWIPVGFLGKAAKREAAQKLAEALDIDGKQAEQENRQLAINLGVRSVPTIFYRHPNGETYRFTGGNPNQLSGLESVAKQYQQR